MVKTDLEKIHEECGVFGAYDISAENVSADVYFGLCALQHRGQESCGIAVTDTTSDECKVSSIKDMGLVNEVFTVERAEELKGNLGVGHVRYSTVGESVRENAQPLVINYIKGTLALAHNGNLVNSAKLREKLARTGAIFQTTTDSELIAYLIARERLETSSVEKAVIKTMDELQGAYSLVIISPRKMIGVRDPFGFRPLCIGKRGSTYFFASESCALDAVDAVFVRDVEPGEVVTIDKDGVINSDRSACGKKPAHCIFEYIYFARPDSVIDGISVYGSRIAAGKVLAKLHPADADIVVGVPDSGTVAAIGYSEQSGIPLGMAFVKNNYVGRTFIKPNQESRTEGVRIKLNALMDVVRDKRVVVIDDSIVRGTTCTRIVGMLKKAGAKEVHVRISAPPFRHPCYFGTDIPNGNDLLASENGVEEMCRQIGADSLAFLENKYLSEIMPVNMGCCDACFSGKYPFEVNESAK